VGTVVDLGLFDSGTTNAVGGEDSFAALAFVAPPLLLLAAGLAVGRAAGANDRDPADAELAGPTAAVGYGLLSATESVTPDPVTGVLLAGVVYPVVFGAGGAVLTSVNGSSTTAESL